MEELTDWISHSVHFLGGVEVGKALPGNKAERLLSRLLGPGVAESMWCRMAPRLR